MINNFLFYTDILKIEKLNSKTRIIFSNGAIDLPFNSIAFYEFLELLIGSKMSLDSFEKVLDDKSQQIWLHSLLKILETNFLIGFSLDIGNLKVKSNFMPNFKKENKFELSNQHIITFFEGQTVIENIVTRARLNITGDKSSSEFFKVLENDKIKKWLACRFFEDAKNQIIAHEDYFISHSTDHSANRKVQLGKKPDFLPNINAYQKQPISPIDHPFDAKKLFESFSSRRTYREKSFDKLNFQGLKDALMFLFQNIDTQEDYPRGFRRIYPSGGGFYEIEPYIVLPSGSDHLSGLYFYDREQRDFVLLEKGEHFSKELLNLETDKASILLVSDLNYLRSKYNQISLKIAYQNSGVLLSYLYLIFGAFSLYGYPKGIESAQRVLKSLEKKSDKSSKLLVIGQFNLV